MGIEFIEQLFPEYQDEPSLMAHLQTAYALKERGYSNDAIAEQMDISIGQVRGLLGRIRDKQYDNLKKE
jgi:DNA-binding CsgD family transcriptional regulator